MPLGARPLLAAKLIGRSDAGGGLTRVVVEPAPGLPASYVTPGQYVEMRTGLATGFFALASEPGDQPWELIMRAGGGASDVVLELPIGSAIELTGALGDGFPVIEAHGRPVLIALGGTGVAAGPPLVSRRIRDGDAARTQVVIGVRAADEVPIEETLARWVEAGVGVTVCVPQGPLAGWTPGAPRFSTGRVQDVLREHRGPLFGGEESRTWIFAVGSAAMIDALREVGGELGVGGVAVNH